jgi:hypothetical protein
MLLKGCLHIHTTSSDGKLTPQEAADAYESRGYDFIAFTDHDYLLKPNYREVLNEVKSDMIIFHGVEITAFVKGYLHVNRIEGDQEVLHVFNHIGEYGLSPEQINDRLSELLKLYPIDVVEITSKGFRDAEFENMEIDLPKMASDDLHASVGIGRAWIELDASRDKDSIIRAIKGGHFWNCYI